MKKSALIFVLLCTSALIGCGKQNDSRNEPTGTVGGTVTPPTDGTYVDVPTPTADLCLQGATNYPAQTWQPYQQQGFVPYSWNTQLGYPNGYPAGYPNGYPNGYPANHTGIRYPGSHGFCGCPTGYMPTCSPNVGMVCAPAFRFRNLGYQMAMYGWQGGFTFGGYAGYSTYFGGMQPAGQYSQYSCSQQIGQTCMVGTNSCGYGICRAVQTNSPIGVCVQ